jgi:hypothetical protein
MGGVAVIVRVMPESPDVNLEQLKKALKQKVPGIREIPEGGESSWHEDRYNLLKSSKRDIIGIPGGAQ